MNFHEDFGRHFEVHRSSNRRFGIWFGLFFSLVGVVPLRSGGRARIWAVAAAALCFGLALLRPAWLNGFNRAWTGLGLLLGRVTNPVIMGLLFFLVVTPTAWLARIMGKDVLRLRFDRAARSYWIETEPGARELDAMTRQF
jgi:hypothetical protein